MGEGLQLSRTVFSSLPYEIRLAILFQMPDFATLHTTLEADESFRAPFWSYESPIVEKVLLKTISPRFFREAVAILDFTFHMWAEVQVDEIWDRYFQRETLPVQWAQWKWKLSDGLIIDDIHEHIRFFKDDFAASALSMHPISCAEESSPLPLSPNEQCRIETTFFRFELYCNFFRRNKKKPELYSAYRVGDREYEVSYMDDVWDPQLYFEGFSFWEREQLACVHDYLIQKVFIAFNDVAEHDVYWGKEKATGYAHGRGSGQKQYILSLGLAFLHRLSVASTYEERYELLKPHLKAYDFFLKRGLGIYEDPSVDKPLSQYTEVEKRALISQSFGEDPDPGPYNAWYWAHEKVYPHTFHFGNPQEFLRERGYVMWDDRRLQEWNMFATPCDDVKYPKTPGLSRQQMMEIEDSWKRRTEIYLDGGRGWWSKEDESKVVWPGGRIKRWSKTWEPVYERRFKEAGQ